MKCDVCGKKMNNVNPDNKIQFSAASNSAMQLSLDCPETATEDTKAFVQKQLGPYKANKYYNVCWECLLKALGVKP